MSNIIDKIQVSGVTYDLPSGGGGNATVELTQAEYDALVSGGTVSANTYYIITDAQAGDLTQYWTSAQTQSAINQATSGKVDSSSVVSSVTSASTDSEIPTAKAVWDVASQGGGGGGTTYSAGTNIDITNDTISCTIPVSADTTNANGVIANYFGNKAGSLSFACGYLTEAKRDYSFVSGIASKTENYYGTAMGSYANTKNWYETAFGQYNNSVSASTTFGDSGNTLFSVGNGTSGARHNAFEIRQNGDMYLNNGTSDIKLQDYLQIKVVKLTQQEYDALATKDNNTLYVIT